MAVLIYYDGRIHVWLSKTRLYSPLAKQKACGSCVPESDGNVSTPVIVLIIRLPSEDYVMDTLDWDHINPATGPVYVEGASAGDVLKVEILDINLAEMGTMCCLPENGVLGKDIQSSSVKKVPCGMDIACLMILSCR